MKNLSKKNHALFRLPRLMVIAVCLLLAPALFASGGEESRESDSGQHRAPEVDYMKDIPENHEIATLGGGCFWCVEAVYEPIEGVYGAVSGYAGGELENPSYQQISTGRTGHAEVVQLYYDPEKISYEQVLKLFFKAHNPTTPDRQGLDVGPQYRSIILTHDDSQAETARKVMKEAQEDWPDPIVTEIEPLTAFYPAEEYHQDFYEKNPNYGYCAAVIRPKMEKLGLEGEDKINVLELDL
ncbi:peptide-methionine (S)-S-oxide reductase MsrA [Salinispira pacifica]|nr:peptide-methionine (S)-S-oxide reductase MsrA [Salinispira pacifica]